MSEKLLPQNIEAEQGVLGSLVIDPEAIAQIADTLHVGDFYRDVHGVIYGAMLHLYERRTPADFITLCDELARSGSLEEVGGMTYIDQLTDEVPTSAHVEHYARIVIKAAEYRQLIHAAGQIATSAYEER